MCTLRTPYPVCSITITILIAISIMIIIAMTNSHTNIDTNIKTIFFIRNIFPLIFIIIYELFTHFNIYVCILSILF